MEIWKDIEGYEGLYQVSNLGRVKSLPRTVPCKLGKFRTTRERILRNSITKKGYYKVVLSKSGLHIQPLVHRLVAKAFIPNPLNLEYVNHKDENPLNCRVDNLEWCTNTYNLNYGTCRERMSQSAKANPRHRNPLTGRFQSKGVIL